MVWCGIKDLLFEQHSEQRNATQRKHGEPGEPVHGCAFTARRDTHSVVAALGVGGYAQGAAFAFI